MLSLVDLHASILTLHVVEPLIGHVYITADFIYFDAGLTIFDGLDNFLFRVSRAQPEV